MEILFVIGIAVSLYLIGVVIHAGWTLASALLYELKAWKRAAKRRAQ